MGQAELIPQQDLLLIRSIFFFYGNAAHDDLCKKIAGDIAEYWNETEASVVIRYKKYRIAFEIEGRLAKHITPQEIFENTEPKSNYFRIEETSPLEVSFVDGIGCNTGFFLLKNLLQDATTAAHEYGHTIGLVHPDNLDIRGKGIPGIMYPRGTIVDAMYQYNPDAMAGDNLNGGTMNPFSRKVLQQDIDNLKLNKLSFDKNGFANVGDFSSMWHEDYGVQ